MDLARRYVYELMQHTPFCKCLLSLWTSSRHPIKAPQIYHTKTNGKRRCCSALLRYSI